jgi:hypothetical protein
MCCNLYDDDMFLQMEWHVLSTLGWAVGHPTVDAFVKLVVKDDPVTFNLTLYILEVALYHRDFVAHLSHTLALSAAYVARHVLGRSQPDLRTDGFASEYNNAVAAGLLQKMKEPSAILARKYASARQSCVSRIMSDFHARKAAMPVARTPLTPTYDVTPPSVLNKTSGSEYFQTYATPQKPQFPGVVQHGLYTPPITPDNEMFGVTQQVNFAAPNQFAPPTPTPGAAGPQYASYPPSTQQWHAETY